MITFMAMATLGGGTAKEVVLGIVIDASAASGSATMKQEQRDELEVNSTYKLLDLLDPTNLSVTIFPTGDMARDPPEGYFMDVTTWGSRPKHEMGTGGMTTGEGLLGQDDQETRFRRARENVEKCYVCGGEALMTVGFMPQPGSVNESVFKIVEDARMKYFVDNSVLVPADAKQSPYKAENYSFTIIPVSSTSYDGKMVRLIDKQAKEGLGLNATGWYDMLAKRFDESTSSGEPMVAVFTNTISGSGDYFDSYKKFIAYAKSNNATFVNLKDLVIAA
jgi:hypothetical protein